MADFPNPNLSPTHIGTTSPYCGAWADGGITGFTGGGTTVWPSANLALFIPIWIPGQFILKSFFTLNGSNAGGNADLGIYGTDGSLMVSTGSTARSGTTTVQVFTLGTPYVLNAGRYYMALACSSAAGAFIAKTPGIVTLQRIGALQAASQVPLANLPTFATCANTYLPRFGISQITTY